MQCRRLRLASTFCSEKPLAANVEQATQMVEACRRGARAFDDGLPEIL